MSCSSNSNNTRDKSPVRGRKPYRPQQHKKVEPQTMKDLRALLEQRGHTCVQIIGMNEYKFEWCQKEKCDFMIIQANAHKRQKKQNKFVSKLEKAGHTCIKLQEIYPGRISWCEKDVCVNK